MRTSRRLLKQARRALLAGFLFSGCINTLMLAAPLYTLQIFEIVVPTGSLETLVALTCIAALALGTLALLEICRDRILLRAGLWLDHVLGQHMLENGLKHDTPAPELKQDAKALQQARAFLIGPGFAPLFDAPWVPLFLLLLTALHPLIGALATGAAVILLLCAIAIGLLTSQPETESARALTRSEHWWGTVASNAQLAGALGLSAGAAQQWEVFNRAYVANAYTAGKRGSFVKAFARGVRGSAQIGIYGLGAWLVMENELAPGALVASAILLVRVLGPFEQTVGGWRGAQAALAAYRRLNALPPDAVVPRLAGDTDAPAGHLILQDVTFYHPGRKLPTLRSVSLAIRPGECIGVVGSNGAGKSTLAQIIAGAAAPTAGVADLDGVPVVKWQRADGPPPIGYLPDEPILIEGTVHDNIARFRNASQTEVVRSAMRAGVHEVLATLPQGYATMVGPAGNGLSQRERRAVALARAIHGAPRLLVLDEPEVNLDPPSLRKLVATLEALKGEGVGFVIATQDPRLLKLTDNVALLGGGTVQAFGPTEQLARRFAATPSGSAEVAA